MSPLPAPPADDEFIDHKPPTSPWIGLTAVGSSVVLALWSVPSNPGPAGALFYPALFLTLGLLFSPALTAFRSPISAFRVENLIMIGLVYWLLLDLLQGLYSLEEVKRETIKFCLLLIGLFAVGVWLAGLHSPWRLPRGVLKAARTNWSEGYLLGGFLICAGLTFFRFALPCGFNPFLMLVSVTNDRWSAPWARGALGGWDAFVDHLVYFGYLLPSLTVLLADRARGWLRPAVIFSLLVTLALTAFLAHNGGRRIIGVMYGSAVLCWVLLHRHTIRLRTMILVSGLAGLTILFVLEVMLEYRGIGYEKIWSERRIQVSLSQAHVDDNILRFAQIIEFVPEHHPHTYAQVFVWALIRPIPRVLWPDKPLDYGFDLPGAIGARGVALTCSVLGEFYLSWGWPMILLGGWLYGRLAGMCNRFLTDAAGQSGVLMYALGAMAIFAGLRSLIDLVLMSYLLIAWIALSAILSPTDDGRIEGQG